MLGYTQIVVCPIRWSAIILSVQIEFNNIVPGLFIVIVVTIVAFIHKGGFSSWPKL